MKGRDLILAAKKTLTYDPIAGIRTKEFTRENPVVGTTSQSNTGNDTSAEFTGYGTVTLSGNGVATATGAGTYTFVDLEAAANSATPEIDAELTDANGATYTGIFLITSFSKTGEQEGIVEFSIALQNKGDVTFVTGT